MEVVHTVCALLDELLPDSPHKPHAQLIQFVADRPGHDRRYAIDARKIKKELGWTPAHTFETGLRHTVEWYLANCAWVESVRTGAYREWMQKNYAARDAFATTALQAARSAEEGKR